MTAIQEAALRAALAKGTDQEDATFNAVRAAFEAASVAPYWSRVYARGAVDDIRTAVLTATRAEVAFQHANAHEPHAARTYALRDAANTALMALTIEEVRVIIAVTAAR